MMEPKNISDLNNALRNSFLAIKKDMDKIKSDIYLVKNTQIMIGNQLKNEVADLKENSVKVDKLNLVKIQLSEINDNIRGVYEKTEEIKKLEKNFVAKKDVAKIENDFRQDMNKFISEIDSRVDLLRKEVRISKEKEASLMSKAEFGGFTSDLNKELEYLRETIEKTYNLKDSITKRELDRRTGELREYCDDLRKNHKELDNKVITYADALQSTKEKVDGLAISTKDNLNVLKQRIDLKVSEPQIKTLLNDINTEFDKLKKEISKLKDSQQDVLTVKKDVSFIKKKAALNEEVEILQDELDKVKEQVITGKDVAKILRERPKELRISAGTAKLTQIKPKAPDKSFKKTLFFANAFIVLSFLSLIGALFAFFASNQDYMDGLSIAAVVWFVIGIALRVFVIIRRE